MEEITPNNQRMSEFLSGNLINNSIFSGDAKIRRIGLDLKVKSVIKNGKDISSDKITIAPQEMFIVVLSGRVKIPKNCFGIAFHILNTGLIDPGYDGCLSTVAINYSNKPTQIRKGDIYLRLVVFDNGKNYAPVQGDNDYQCTDDEYIKNRILDSDKYPNTFLDVEAQTEKFINKNANLISSGVTNKIIYLLTIVTVVISVATYWLGNTNINNIQQSFYQKTNELIQVKSNDQIAELNKKYNDILEKLENLEKLESLKNLDDLKTKKK